MRSGKTSRKTIHSTSGEATLMLRYMDQAVRKSKKASAQAASKRLKKLKKLRHLRS